MIVIERELVFLFWSTHCYLWCPLSIRGPKFPHTTSNTRCWTREVKGGSNTLLTEGTSKYILRPRYLSSAQIYRPRNFFDVQQLTSSQFIAEVLGLAFDTKNKKMFVYLGSNTLVLEKLCSIKSFSNVSTYF